MRRKLTSYEIFLLGLMILLAISSFTNVSVGLFGFTYTDEFGETIDSFLVDLINSVPFIMIALLVYYRDIYDKIVFYLVYLFIQWMIFNFAALSGLLFVIPLPLSIILILLFLVQFYFIHQMIRKK